MVCGQLVYIALLLGITIDLNAWAQLTGCDTASVNNGLFFSLYVLSL